MAAKLFDEMLEKDLILWNLMIGGYVKYGRIEDVKGLFDVMLRRDVVIWVIMIDGYGKLGLVYEVKILFD